MTAAVASPANSTSVPPVETSGRLNMLPPTGSPSGFATSRNGQFQVCVAPASQSLTAGICATAKIATISA